MTSLPEPLIITGNHLSTAFLLPDRKAASPPARGRAVQVQGGSVAAVEDVFRRPAREGRSGWGKPTVIRVPKGSSQRPRVRFV